MSEQDLEQDLADRWTAIEARLLTAERRLQLGASLSQHIAAGGAPTTEERQHLGAWTILEARLLAVEQWIGLSAPAPPLHTQPAQQQPPPPQLAVSSVLSMDASRLERCERAILFSRCDMFCRPL